MNPPVPCLSRPFSLSPVDGRIGALLPRAAGGRLWHGCAVLTAASMAARGALTFGLSATFG